MFENFKDGDLITLKLASGEEVISTYKSKTDSYISVEKPLTLMQGPQGLAFGTFFATAKQDEPINIAIDKITSIAISYGHLPIHFRALLDVNKS